jgi:hypothetical protein
MRAGEICQISPSEVSIGRAPFVAEVPAPAGSPSIQGDDDMAQYLLSVWHDEDFDLDELPDDFPRVAAQVGAFNDELAAAGAMVFAGGLHPASSATVVRPNGAEVSMTDGPYAESKELMGGFWVVEASDLDAALEWARKGALACEGPVEVRPFQGE